MPVPPSNSPLSWLLAVPAVAVSEMVGIVPLLGLVVWLVAAIWQLVAMVVAVRQALDYRGTGRAVLVCLIGWVFYMMVSIGLAMAMGIGSVVMGG